jgi:hypothetical protein
MNRLTRGAVFSGMIEIEGGRSFLKSGRLSAELGMPGMDTGGEHDDEREQ